MNAETLFKQICERCENHAKNMSCEDMIGCPAYALYCIAKSKKKVVYRQNEWQEPPTPRPEMI